MLALAIFAAYSALIIAGAPLAAHASAANEKTLKMTVEAEGEAVAGQPLAFKIRIENVGDHDVIVVRCLEGSTSRLRYPLFGCTIRPGRSFRDPGGCGVVSPLRAGDLTTLKPGESFDPGLWLNQWTPPSKGTYKVVFVCDYDCEDPALWQPASSDLAEEIRNVPKVELRAGIEVQVKK